MCIRDRVYYELRAARRKAEQADVALVRVEMLYPCPIEAMKAEIARYPKAEVIWCQEEPRNMGAWTSILDWFIEADLAPPRYVGRPPAASPATGSHRKHRDEQDAVIRGVLEF